MSEPIARSVVVHGHVQGVFFRDATRRAARGAGVTGWVANAEDGTVRAHLEGPPAAVEEVLTVMRRGPEQAVVERVEVNDVPVERHSEFVSR